MSTQPLPKLADFEMLALRSDGFIEARRFADQMPVLVRKEEMNAVATPSLRLQFQQFCARFRDLRGPGVLPLIEAFEDEGAFVSVLPHFAGRSVGVQFSRGRQFTFREAFGLAAGVARSLAESRVAHGALRPTNLLLNDQNEARLAPPRFFEVAAQRRPAVSADIRQLALLVGELVLGEPQAEPDSDARTLTSWTLQPGVPAQYRTILQFMLAPAGPHYQGWPDCLRDLQAVARGRRVGAAQSGSFAGRATAGTAILAVLAAGGWFWQKSHMAKPPVVAVHQVEVTPAPVIAAAPVVEKPQAAPAPQEAAPVIDEAKDLIEYTRAAGDALKLAAARNYPGAEAMLGRWLAEHPSSPNREAAQRQADRIRLAQTALASLAAHGRELAGAAVPLPDKTQGVISAIAGSALTLSVQSQFGAVSKTVDLTTLSDATIAGLLGRIDKAGGTASASEFLLGGAHFAEALALIKDAGPGGEAVRSWAGDWEKLARDREALAGLDRVAAFIDSRDFPSAGKELARVRAAYAESAIVTKARSADIYQWDQQIAAAASAKSAELVASADAYPGLPKLTLAAAVPVGDPDFKQLVAGTQWAITHGDWKKHRESLDQAISTAAAMGTWTQYPTNLERLLKLSAPSLMVSQDTVLHLIDSGALDDLPKDKDTSDFLSWLFTNPRAMEYLAETITPQDKPKRVLEIWRDCWKDNPREADQYMALALAVAVDFDNGIRVRSDFYGIGNHSDSDQPRETNIDPVERYRFYRDCSKRNALKAPLAELRPFELIWVVDAPVPTSELEWAQKNMNLTRRDWGKAYGMIRYRMDKAARGVQLYDSYTLAEIKEKGGICADQAYFASVTAKANGIPAMVLSAEGDRGAHAWFGYEATKTAWNLNTGRYADHYAAGRAEDPQTRQSVKEQELREMGASERKTDNWALTDRYLQLSDFLANAKRPELARVALDAAVRVTPQHLGAWNRRMDAIAAAKVSVEEFQREIGRMRVAFEKYPDVVQDINKRETDYLAANGDAQAALVAVERQGQHLVNKDASRTDLILESVYKEVALAEKSGDPLLPGKIYHEALREKGKEVVAFKALAPRYYEWAKAQQHGAEVVHEIDQTYQRNFKEPKGDYFTMGAYKDGLEVVAGLFKKEGLDADVRRLEKKIEEVDDRRKQIGDQSRRNEKT